MRFKGATFSGAVLLAATLLGMASCAGIISGSSPPLYYDVDHPHQSAPCSYNFKQAIRVWPFSASSPFDRQEMVILGSSHEVRFSSQFRWVTLPGSLLSDGVLRDLSQSGLFTKVVGMMDPFNAPLEMGGHVFRFAWEEKDSTARAVLDIEVSLWSKEPERDVLFHKSYHFEGEPTSERGSAHFADAMSRLVQRFTTELQKDLCSAAAKTDAQ